MGLIKCVDCATEVSSEATACPKCGRPTPKVETAAKNTRANSAILAVIFLGACVWIGVSVSRSWSGADFIGKECTLTIKAGSAASVFLMPTEPRANSAYGAALSGRLTDDKLEGATWVPAGTRATIREKEGLSWRVTSPAGSGWVSHDLCVAPGQK